MSRTTSSPQRYRRSPHLVAHWRNGQLILESYARAVEIESSPLVLDVLDRFSDWSPADEVAGQLPHVPRELLQALIDALAEHGALEIASSPNPSPWDAWRHWSPAASFFHQSTKDVAFTNRAETNRRLRTRAETDPIPPPLKPPRGNKRIPLPPPHPAAMRTASVASGTNGGSESDAPAEMLVALKPNAATKTKAMPAAARNQGTAKRAQPAQPAQLAQSAQPAARAEVTSAKGGARGIVGFPDVLLSRRTWRRFGRRYLQVDELSTLLGLTWGVQAWMEVEGWGRMALKTSPSGGARHSIEAYLLVRRVEGVEPGIYHYQPASHELHLIRRLTPQASRAAILAYLPRQTFYGQASAVVLMTTVFARVQWRYAFARAYRTILAEAGHHAQTFCLLATWLGLAPFCTMALADTRIERDLGIDGVSESVLYAAGVGPRPPDTTWAPWPRAGETPARTPNELGQGLGGRRRRRR